MASRISRSAALKLHILDELRRVLPRLAQRHGLTLAEIDDFVDTLSILAEVIEPLAGADPDLRDAADRALSHCYTSHVLGRARRALMVAAAASKALAQI